jgi:hypothetical protein
VLIVHCFFISELPHLSLNEILKERRLDAKQIFLHVLIHQHEEDCSVEEVETVHALFGNLLILSWVREYRKHLLLQKDQLFEALVLELFVKELNGLELANQFVAHWHSKEGVNFRTYHSFVVWRVKEL